MDAYLILLQVGALAPQLVDASPGPTGTYPTEVSPGEAGGTGGWWQTQNTSTQLPVPLVGVSHEPA